MAVSKSDIACLIGALLLAGCGGGGSISSQPSKPSVPKPQPPVQHMSLQEKSAADRQSAISGSGAVVVLSDIGNLLYAEAPFLKGKSISSDVLEIGRYVPTSPNYGNQSPYFNAFRAHTTQMSYQILSRAPSARIELANSGCVGYGRLLNHPASRLKNQKGLIINASFCSREYIPTTTLPVLPDETINRNKEDLDTLLAMKSLAISATGNDGKIRPTVEKLLPLYVPKYQEALLLVTGLHPDGTFNTQYNRCGEAWPYCVAYKGTLTNYDGKTVYGTSGATAAVSGFAARIKSRYDWMMGHNIKDVLITTAIERGDRYTFGMGEVDPVRSLGGYGHFDGQVALNVEGNKRIYYFDNNITGDGAITKTGRDTLALMGDNTFSGTNQIRSGRLLLNGKNNAGSVIHADGALTVGDGLSITSGSIINNGKIESLTTSDLTVNGDLINTGDIHKAIGSKIDIKGTASILRGNLYVAGVAHGYITTAGKRETLLQANSIIGAFDKIDTENVAPLIQSTVNISDNTISVDVSRRHVGNVMQSYQRFADSPAAASVMDEVLMKMDQKHAADTLSATDAALAQSYITQSAGLVGKTFSMTAGTESRAVANLSKVGAAESLRFIHKAQTLGQGVWGSQYYANGKMPVEGIDADATTHATQIGTAYRQAQHTFAAGFNIRTSQWDEALKQYSKSLKADAYGINLGYIYHQNEALDLFSFVGANYLKAKTALSDSNGHQYHIGLGTSYRKILGERWQLRPNIALQYVHSRLKDLQIEENVWVNDLRNYRLEAAVGLDALYRLTQNLSIHAEANIRHALDHRHQYRARYASIDISRDGKIRDKVFYDLGFGLSYWLTSQAVLSAKVNHERSGDWQQNSGLLNFTYQF